MKIYLLIPSYKPNAPLLDKTLEAIKRTNNVEINLLVCSSDKSSAQNRNYGIQKALDDNADFIVFCDDDITDFSDQWLFKMLQHFSVSDVGVVGCAIINRDHATMWSAEMQISGLNFGTTGHGDLYQNYRYTKQVKGVVSICSAFRAQVFRDIGLIDETYKGSQWDDVDVAFNVHYRTKWKVIYDGSIWCIHDTLRREAQYYQQSQDYFMNKWQNLVY